MTPEQIQLVQSSFAKVEPIADQAAELFYNRLFEIAPEVKPLFKNDMKKQGQKLMQTLAVAVYGLSNPTSIIHAVQELGKRHAGYGVTSAHYEPVANALLWTLEQGLGEAFTPEVKEAWVAAYQTLAGIMIEAAEGAAG